MNTIVGVGHHGDIPVNNDWIKSLVKITFSESVNKLCGLCVIFMKIFISTTFSALVVSSIIDIALSVF